MKARARHRKQNCSGRSQVISPHICQACLVMLKLAKCVTRSLTICYKHLDSCVAGSVSDKLPANRNHDVQEDDHMLEIKIKTATDAMDRLDVNCSPVH